MLELHLQRSSSNSSKRSFPRTGISKVSRNMKIFKQPVLEVAMLIIYLSSITCNPLGFDPTSAPSMIALPPMPLSPPMVFGPQFNPYHHMQSVPHQYYLPPPFGSSPFNNYRRSIAASSFKPIEKKSYKLGQDENDLEQKAIGDLPVSLMEPDSPTSVSERISDSFSAIGEGVRNHFRSMSENFSDTMDDIKDAWRTSDSSTRKYGSRLI